MEDKRIIRKALFIIIFSLIYLGISVLVAILISNNSNNNIQDIMTYEGIILIIIGILMSMKGNPSGMSISKMGQSDANMSAYLNNEITQIERSIHPYHKDYFRNNVVEIVSCNLTFILGGILILAVCLFGL